MGEQMHWQEKPESILHISGNDAGILYLLHGVVLYLCEFSPGLWDEQRTTLNQLIYRLINYTQKRPGLA